MRNADGSITCPDCCIDIMEDEMLWREEKQAFVCPVCYTSLPVFEEEA